MGRRKERRLAALSAAGRRVKLDLFAEPSGDLGGSSMNEVEGDLDQNNAGVPNSPSSSGFGRELFFILGRRQDNPLLLLGQYSDDELTEETNSKLQNASTATTPIDQNGKEEEPVDGGCNCEEDKTGEGSVCRQIKQEEWKVESAQANVVMDLDGNGVQENGIASSGDPCKKVDSVTQISDPLTSGTQISVDSSSGWKIVMHEESNQYYYWNTETGETSWEIPEALSQVAEMASEKEVHSVGDERESIHANTSAPCNLNEGLALYANATAIAESGCVHLVSEAREKYEIGVQSENTNEGFEGENQGQNLTYSLYGNEPKGGQNPSTSNFEDTRNHQLVANEDLDRGLALSSANLVEYGQKLLQKLKELERFNEQPQGNAWISRYIFEIEIRLSDCKSLAAYGTSLLPFWVHSEEKLRALENSIDAEVSYFYKSVQLNEAVSRQISSGEGDNSSLQRLGEEPRANEKGQVAPSTLVKPHPIPNVDSLEVVQKEDNGRSISVDACVRHISPSASPMQHLGAIAEENLQEVKKTANPADLILKSEPFPANDMDMDVDMEVDDETTADHRTPEDISCIDHSLSQQCPEEEHSVPPPPDEDWIPPPPPDNEPVPPPPPSDEPLGTAYPPQPTFPETAQQFPYTEQYNVAYSVGFDYYGPVITEVASTSYYGHTDGQQTAVPQPPQYYATVSNTYSEATSVIVNPVEPLVYYDFPNGTNPTRPVISSLETSGFYGEPGSVSYVDTSTADQVGSLMGPVESGGSLSTNLKAESDASAASCEAEMKAVQIPSLSTVSQVTATAVGENAPASLIAVSAAAAAPAPSIAATKVQSKVLRSKKRAVAVAPTLRSNKKVSSLVDKWKAAKEELHEDEEDEPENAYEMFERKRQKEIEEWRAQQIASGEAKDNANFQPLGANWRERVKRKRAQSTSNVVQTPPDVSTSEKQQPDLIELSKDLPSGWQAYWDESSKEVYYGNVITSETSWTKPTR